MKKNVLKAALMSIIATTFIGCAVAPYQVNPSSPKAFVRNAIQGTSDRNNSIGVNIYDGKKRFNLYYIYSNKTTLEGSIAVEANKPLTFSYNEAMGGNRSCGIDVKATLEPNKQYAFVGGTKFEKGLIPFLPDRGCEFGIKDLATGTLISN